jgi:hypothetical protein
MEGISMKDTNKTPKLKSREAADASREVNASELNVEDLSKVSGGQSCTAGVHYAGGEQKE